MAPDTDGAAAVRPRTWQDQTSRIMATYAISGIEGGL